MLTSIRVARREKGRRWNSINRYSSTLKCGNDCRARSRTNFFPQPHGTRGTLDAPPQRRRNRYCGFLKTRDVEKEKWERNCTSIYLEFKYLKIAGTYADTVHASLICVQAVIIQQCIRYVTTSARNSEKWWNQYAKHVVLIVYDKRII